MPDEFKPLTLEEAQALMAEALTGVDRNTLLAERAEAEAQLRAAEATLGISPASGNGQNGSEDEAAGSGGDPDEMDGAGPETAVAARADGRPAFDVAELRRAAAAARAADDRLARAASEASGRPVPGESQLGTAESAMAGALQAQDDVGAAWRRLVGALISASGMAIVIGALGWNIYWLLVPIALIAVMTVDLRVAGRAARQASEEAALELALVGVAGAGGLDEIQRERVRLEEAEHRLAEARAERDAAYARFAALAPGRSPSEVDAILAEHQEAEEEAAEAAQPAAEPEPAEPVQEPAAEAPEAAPEPVVASPEMAAAEWWFGPTSTPTPPAAEPPAAEPPAAEAPGAPEGPVPEPPPAPQPVSPPSPGPPPPVRALAERLSAEGREALARIEAQLAALDRLELAKRSLEWHENHTAGREQAAESVTNPGAGDPTASEPPPGT